MSGAPAAEGDIGAQVAMLRRQGVRWKVIERRFATFKPHRLRELRDAHLGRRRCVCPACGTAFDPKQHRRPA